MSEKKLTEIIDAETKASEQTQGNPSSGVKQRSGASAVYSLRPPADKIVKLQEVAASTGVPPTVLLRRLGHRTTRTRPRTKPFAN